MVFNFEFDRLLNVLLIILPLAGEDKPRPYFFGQALLVAAGFIPARKYILNKKKFKNRGAKS